MKFFTCPKCKEDVIPVRDKYYTSIWMNIYCRNCGARLCAEPIVMALLYFTYFWMAAWFITWAWMEDTWLPIFYLIPLWLLVDIMSVMYMPLMVLRAKRP